jgi:hypothetical protein
VNGNEFVAPLTVAITPSVAGLCRHFLESHTVCPDVAHLKTSTPPVDILSFNKHSLLALILLPSETHVLQNPDKDVFFFGKETIVFVILQQAVSSHPRQFLSV